MGVLRQPESGEELDEIPLLTAQLVMDWRWREEKWKRRARLVARDFGWEDPNRAPGGQSLLRLVPAICQVKGWQMMTMRCLYLMCSQPKQVKASLGSALAERLGLPEQWILKVLPGQREGAAQWFQELKSTLKRGGLEPCPEAPTLWRGEGVVLLVHVDDCFRSVEE